MWRPLLMGAPVFILLLSLAGFLWHRPLLLTLIYASIGIYLLWRRWSAATISYYLVGFFCGPMAEYFAVTYGAWTYSNPGPWSPLPPWLPFGWGIAAVYLKSTADVLTRLLAERLATAESLPVSEDRKSHHPS